MGWIRFVSFLIVVLSVVPATGKTSKVDDLLPWPWGTECPFPWTRIEGEWVGKSQKITERFTLIIKDELESGAKILEVKRYDDLDNLIGQGEGVAPKGQRIVRAAMLGVGNYDGESYWALIRTYSEAPKKACTKNKQVMVITLRPTYEKSEQQDVHIVVDREGAARRNKK